MSVITSMERRIARASEKCSASAAQRETRDPRVRTDKDKGKGKGKLAKLKLKQQENPKGTSWTLKLADGTKVKAAVARKGQGGVAQEYCRQWAVGTCCSDGSPCPHNRVHKCCVYMKKGGICNKDHRARDHPPSEAKRV